MKLYNFINHSFPAGLTYNEAAQLCLHIYSTLDNVPKELHSQCNKEELAEVFAELSTNNFITTKDIEAAYYGANFHQISDKGHWVEVIASMFKKEKIVDLEIVNELTKHITSRST